MRGIGQGQTLTLLIIPEVAKLITTEVAKGAGRPPPAPAAAAATAAAGGGGLSSGVFGGAALLAVLNDVAAWLLINQMQLERTQYSMLCCQVWRSHTVWGAPGFRV